MWLYLLMMDNRSESEQLFNQMLAHCVLSETHLNNICGRKENIMLV